MEKQRYWNAKCDRSHCLTGKKNITDTEDKTNAEFCIVFNSQGRQKIHLFI